jgi:uncharacterized protein
VTQRRPRLAIGLAGCVLAQSLAGCGAAADQAAPATPVVDSADILPPTDEASLNGKLTDYWKASGNALVVISVPSLEGKTIEQYAFDLFNERGVGDAKRGRGLLLLVAPNERQLRIEVGCGLEGVITDEEAAAVIRDDITPRFRTGDLAGGTIAGVDALIEELAKPPTSGPPVSPICKENRKEAA